MAENQKKAGLAAMSGPLKGIKILDLSWILSGPFATMVLADLGAEVIKVERPGWGDLARGNGPFIDGESSYFLSINRGKKSLTLDLQKDEGKKIFLELVKKADVVVENFSAGTLSRLGLGYEAISKVNPGIILASISGFGQDGPYKSKPALDVIVQAMGGIMSITGEPGRPPIRPGVSYGDIAAGLYCSVAVVAAVYERAKSGRGQAIDISMLDCQVAVLENAFARYFATGEVPAPLGTRHPVFTPFQAFETKDGYIVVAIVGGTKNQWPLFCVTLGLIDLIDDQRFRDGWSRTTHYAELEPILTSTMRSKTSREWLEELSEVGIACGPVNNIAQAAADPQVIYRDMIIQVPHPRLGEVKTVNTPIRMSATPARVEKAAPDLGQDTRDVLKGWLGLDDKEIDRLAKAEII
ncbi:MAG: CaiB/BaiF CoA-transferase family protein [Dehalococcoidia bacterium]|nr:CaiB/BaiF CoA-transferase family protein [Dehalococcoidia bacterium]